MNEQQLNEGVKELVLTLLTLASGMYSANNILRKLEQQPEPVEQKIDALKIADKKVNDSQFDKSVNTILKYYVNKGKKKSQPSTQPNSGNGLVEFIKKHEDFSNVPYWDFKQYSIGYGTKALPTDKFISKQEAMRRLIKEVEKHRTAVIKAKEQWGYNWTPDQINALTSFRYNVGSLAKLTDNGTRSNEEIAKKILEYNKAGGKPAKGLINRRKYEQMMFVSKI